MLEHLLNDQLKDFLGYLKDGLRHLHGLEPKHGQPAQLLDLYAVVNALALPGQ